MKKNYKEFLDSYLKDESFAFDFLTQSLEESDISSFLLLLKDLVRVHDASLKKEASKIADFRAYKRLSKHDDSFKTVYEVLNLLGYSFSICKRKAK